MIVAGTRLAGKVDQSSAGYVVTRFVHVWFVPLVPLSSWFVTEAGARSIPFSLKSAFVGYARGFGVVAALGGGGGFLYYLIFEFYDRFEIYQRGGASVTEDELVGHAVFLAVLGVLAVAGVAVFLLTRLLTRASVARCAELSRATGLNVTPL